MLTLSKDQRHKVLSCFSLCLPLFFFGFFIFFLFHVSSLLFTFVFSFSLGFLEPASIPAESSHYCWSSVRNSVFWLKYDFDLHPLPAAEWGCYGSWSLPYLLLPKVSEELMLLFKLASQFSFCSFVLFCRVGFPLFLVC
jgi:hypothetical protein